ncbi:MAG: tetratricopeptide repeat protein [Flavobacteriales bacterium]|nr:tetratricopeptide repeat protein [Flavobacteriales bacterium]
MHKIIKLLLLTLFFSVQLKAQYTNLVKASTLFSEEKYSAAQALFQQLIINDRTNEQASYYNAKCSKELFASDAIFLYEQFLMTFPYSLFIQQVNEDLALLYYNDLDYPKAIKYFIQFNSLEQHPDLVFKLAYANFSIDSLIDAQYYFSKLINTESKYAATAQYYSAYIAYQNGLYETALSGFKHLITNKQFESIIPYYITQIYFFQQSYKQLIAFASPLLEIVIPSRKAEVSRLLAEAYYRTKDFENSIIHFTAYIEQVDQVNPIINFLLGQSYFKVDEFDNAINYLEKVNSSVDSINQHATYCLGASYLKVKQFNYALQAFKKSASYSYDKVIQEEAFYNYAKLSYQLDLPFDNTLLVLKTYLEKYDNTIHKKEIEILMLQVFQISSKYDEAFDVLSAIHLPDQQQQKSLQQLAFFLGVKEYNTAAYRKALTYFQLATQYPIDDKIAYVTSFWLADCYYQLNDFARSVELYTNLPVNNSANFGFYHELKQYYLAYAYFMQAEYKRANIYFRKYEKLATDSMHLNDTYLRIADCFFMNQKYSLSEKYYDKAIAFSLFDGDYAIYKRSVALGLMGKNNTKLTLLKQLTSDCLTSIYYDNALYDLARYYKNTSKNDLALSYYEKLLDETKDEQFIADAHLSKGMIYFNSGKVDQAIISFLFVVNNFQQTIYFKEALSGLQAAYVSLAKVDEYLAIVNGLPEISISRAEQDSLTYNTAFMKFSEGDYPVANTTFNQYLEKFENGIFKIDAAYYNAISCVKVGDTTNAVLMYSKLIGASNAEYQQSALSFLARKYYAEDDYANSNIYYQTLEKVASNNSLKREVVIRLMYGNERLKTGLAYNYAQQVIKLDKTDDWLMSKAKIIIARDEFSAGNYAKSKTTFEKVVELSDYDEGAEAKYYLAYLTYLDDSLALSEKMIFELAESYTSDYFIAKAFILLADIYVVQKNDFQAKATLESIIENHDGEELVNLARKNWELIVERENLKNAIKEQPQSYIEISEEEIDYDLEEFLIEEVIDEDYKVVAPDTLMAPKTDSLEIINGYIETDEIE